MSAATSAAPLVLIPALLCDAALYRGVVDGLGSAADAQVLVAARDDAAASVAEVSTTGMPARVAIRAASTLVTMPPVPTPARPALPRVTPARSSSWRTSGMRVTPGRDGSPV